MSSSRINDIEYWSFEATIIYSCIVLTSLRVFLNACKILNCKVNLSLMLHWSIWFFFSIFSQIITCNKNGMLNVMTSKSISFNGLWGVSPEKAFSLFMLNINILLFIYFLCIFDFSPVFFHQGLQVNTHIWNVLKQLIFCQLQSRERKTLHWETSITMVLQTHPAFLCKTIYDIF